MTIKPLYYPEYPVMKYFDLDFRYYKDLKLYDLEQYQYPYFQDEK